MKILQVSTHMNMGGIASYILSLSAALKKKGTSVIVASSGGDLEPELKKINVPHMKLSMDTKFELSPKVLKSAVRLSGIVKSEKVDIIHAHSRVSQASSFFASHLAGVQYVTTCHGYFKKRFRGIFDTWGEKVIAISDAVKIHLENDLNVKDDRIELIYNGVDIDRFSKRYSGEEISGIKKALGLEEGPVIGTIGRLSSVKGQKFLVEAMREVVSKVPSAQCLIVGNGEEREALKRLAGTLGIENSTYFMPADPDTHKFLSIMDVFVFPSIKEGLGIALLEALASGKACVASDIGGISNIIEEGQNGMLVPVGDFKAISGAITKLINDASLRTKLGENGRGIIRRQFSLEIMADKVMKLYEEIAKK